MGNHVCSLRYLKSEHKQEYNVIINKLIKEYNLHEDRNNYTMDYDPRYVQMCVEPTGLHYLFNPVSHLKNFSIDLDKQLPIKIDMEFMFLPI